MAMTTKPWKPVRGHELKGNGAPYDASGDRRREFLGLQHGGLGRAICSCGEISEELKSDHLRKKWHSSHKGAIQTETRGE